MCGGKSLVGALVAGALALCGASSAGAAEVVYVSTQGSGVQAYQVGTNGALTRVAGSPFPAGNDGIGVSVTPDRRHLYVSNYGDETLSAFSVAPVTGALSALTGSPFPAGQAVLSAVTPDGRFLYVAGDGTPGQVSGFAIDPATGTLTAVPGSPVTAGAAPYGVAVSHDGKFLYVSEVASSPTAGSVAVYRIDPATGALTAVGTPVAAGVNPAAIAVSPDDRRVYVANSFDETVSGWDRDPATGLLTALPGSPFPAGPGEPTGLVVTPDGRHLYTANSSETNADHNVVLGFAVDAATGALTPVAGSPYAAPAGPQLAALTADGLKLYVTDVGAAAVSGYAVDPPTGRLSPLPDSPFPTADNPLGIAIASPPAVVPPVVPPPPVVVPPVVPHGVPALGEATVHVGRRGVLSPLVRCSGGQGCQGQITLRGGAGRLAAGSFAVPAGQTQPVPVSLNATGRRLLSHRARVRVTVTLAPAGGSLVVAPLGLLAAHAPGAAIRGHRVHVNADGRFRVRVRCVRRNAGACRGRLVLRTRRGRIVAARKVLLRPGHGRRLRLRLRHRDRVLIGRHRTLRVVARTRTRVPVGLATRRRHRLTLH